MGSMESDYDDRYIHPGHRHVAVCGEPDLFLLGGAQGGKRSLGRMDSRMVGEFASPRVQLCQDSRRQEPASALGPQASGRSRLEVRIDGGTRLSSPAITRPSIEPEWALPSRGRVGMFSLI